MVREGGFEALPRRRRSDPGKPRRASQEIIDKAVEMKKDQPRRSEETINKFLQQEFQTTLPKSTLHQPGWKKRARAGARAREAKFLEDTKFSGHAADGLHLLRALHDLISALAV